MKRSAVHEV